MSKKVIRTCIICKGQYEQKDLNRILIKNNIGEKWSKTNNIGRSFYVCNNSNCIFLFLRKKKMILSKINVKDISEELEAEMKNKHFENLIGFLGLLYKGKNLYLGLDQLEERLKAGGKVFLVIIAEDLGENSVKKINNLQEKYNFKKIVLGSKKDYSVIFKNKKIGVMYFIDHKISNELVNKIEVLNEHI